MAAITMSELSEPLTARILGNLKCPREEPTLRYLNRLIYAYVRTVPWESVSRVVKRRATPETRDCPRLPEEFWNSAIERGLGGTCFESSLAFYSLLIALGYEGYLTVNDMGETRGCHAATTVLIGDRKYLVDVTIPVLAALRIDPRRITRRQAPVYDHTLHPVGDDRYEVRRSHNSRRSSFTLIDVPVSLPDYHLIVQNDYLATGNFNKSVVINKVIDQTMTRFVSDHFPYKLEQHNRRGRREADSVTSFL